MPWQILNRRATVNIRRCRSVSFGFEYFRSHCSIKQHPRFIFRMMNRRCYLHRFTNSFRVPQSSLLHHCHNFEMVTIAWSLLKFYSSIYHTWHGRPFILYEGLQPVVQQSIICPSGSRALRSQTWFRKIDARSCVEGLITEYIDAISCVDFVKPCLALQSSWARRANCGLLHYWLEPFNW